MIDLSKRALKAERLYDRAGNLRFEATPGDEIFSFDGRLTVISDGDTVHCDLLVSRDFGFGVKQIMTLSVILRLFALDAPKKDTPMGQSCIDELVRLTTGYRLVIQTIKNRKDQYGRYLAVLWRADGHNDKSINDQLVEGGFAVPWDGKGPHPPGGG